MACQPPLYTFSVGPPSSFGLGHLDEVADRALGSGSDSDLNGFQEGCSAILSGIRAGLRPIGVQGSTVMAPPLVPQITKGCLGSRVGPFPQVIHTIVDNFGGDLTEKAWPFPGGRTTLLHLRITTKARDKSTGPSSVKRIRPQRRNLLLAFYDISSTASPPSDRAPGLNGARNVANVLRRNGARQHFRYLSLTS